MYVFIFVCLFLTLSSKQTTRSSPVELHKLHVLKVNTDEGTFFVSVSIFCDGRY